MLMTLFCMHNCRPIIIYQIVVMNACVWPKHVNNIDAFIGPSLDEFKFLCKRLPNTYNSHTKELFCMRVVLLWTMTNFLGKLNGDSSRLIHSYVNFDKLWKCKLSSKFNNVVCKIGSCVWFSNLWHQACNVCVDNL